MHRSQSPCRSADVDLLWRCGMVARRLLAADVAARARGARAPSRPPRRPIPRRRGSRRSRRGTSSSRRRPRARRRDAGDLRALREHVLGDRPPVQPGLRGDAQRESRRRSVAAGRGHADLSADADDPARSAAQRESSSTCRRCGSTTSRLKRARRRRAAAKARAGRQGLEPSRSASASRAGRTPFGEAKVTQKASDPVWYVPASDSQGARRARRSAAERRAARARQSARRLRDDVVAAGLSDPRHEQAGRRRHALEPRLHSLVPRGHRGAVLAASRAAPRCGS